MSSRSPNILLWSFTAIAVTVCSFCVNLGGTWYGGPAKLNNLFMTIFYAVLGGIFTLMNRNSRVLSRISFVISCLTFVSSVISLIAMRGGEFFVVLAVVLAVFSAVPMYGLRLFLGWKQLYASVTVLSLCWLTVITFTSQAGNKK